MKAVVVNAEWKPRKGFILGNKDIEGKLTYQSNQVWYKPKVNLTEKPVPEINDREVLIKVRAAGICGSDANISKMDKDGYMYYPSLIALPLVLGHEFTGEVVKAGKNAINKRTNKPFMEGDKVFTEGMLWCGYCKPCCDGFPNHCENIQLLGGTIDGGFAEYAKVEAKYCWSLDKLEGIYKGSDVFVAGSLIEPTSVAYTAVIVRGGGIRPGDNAVILGGGPIGLAAVAILKKAGGVNVILSEPSDSRGEIAKKLGADYIINPLKEDFVEKVLRYTDGMGATIYLEATGLPEVIFKDIENAIWNSKGLNSTIVIVGKAGAKIPITGEIYQDRRANITGSQGHSGDGTIAHVIGLMAGGMDMTQMVTKRIKLEEVPRYVIDLQTNKENCKVTAIL